MVVLMLKVRKCIETRIGNDDHVAAVPPIAASRASKRHVLFTAECNDTRAAVPALYVQGYFIQKHSGASIPRSMAKIKDAVRPASRVVRRVRNRVDWIRLMITLQYARYQIVQFGHSRNCWQILHGGMRLRRN